MRCTFILNTISAIPTPSLSFKFLIFSSSSSVLQYETFNRFRESFIKQYANIEHRRLCTAAQSTTATATPSSLISLAAAECIPLVALDSTTGACAGSLDIRPNYTPEDPQLVEELETIHDSNHTAAYVYNVVVAETLRRSGVGRQLIAAAKEIAIDQLNASLLFAHVDSVNDAASGLYRTCGFEAVAIEGGVDGTSVGRRTLMRCRLLE
jgi:ribosomal protein S18 acetylase RimI-like enzyme